MIAETGIYMPEIIAIISDYAKTYAFSMFEDYARWARAIVISEKEFGTYMYFRPKFLGIGDIAIMPKTDETIPGLAYIEVHYREHNDLFKSQEFILNDAENDETRLNCRQFAPWFESICDLFGYDGQSNAWQKKWRDQSMFPGFSYLCEAMVLDIRKWITEVDLKTSCGHE